MVTRIQIDSFEANIRCRFSNEVTALVGFHHGPLLQGQMRIAKLKSAYNSLIIGPRGFEWKTNL